MSASEHELESPPTHPITRTVAIVKTHALEHRLDIEPRIYEAGFEIVKERQMEFDMESDPDFMYELFGDDVDSLAEGPVWVYILERRRAVEVWSAIMGHPDPAVAREESPTSLRSLYGISLVQNAVMGSPDNQIAEFQIASLFQSSPIYSLSDLPDEGANGNGDTGRYGTVRSHNGSARTSSTTGGPRLNANGKILFRARPLPKTHVAPDIAPRTTKAAALRAGQVVASVDKVTRTVPRAAPSKAALQKTFANVPGHKRTEAIPVASTAAPIIAPRMTKAASLRIDKEAAAAAKKKPGPKPAAKPAAKSSTPSTTKSTPSPQKSDPSKTFEGVPGHKRRETIAVASVKAPTVAPRTNRSAALRATKDAAPPSSYRSSSTARPLSRSSSQSSLSPDRPSRSASVASVREKDPEPAPVKKARPRPVSLLAPTIAPRPNKSALLRANKDANGDSAKAFR